MFWRAKKKLYGCSRVTLAELKLRMQGFCGERFGETICDGLISVPDRSFEVPARLVEHRFALNPFAVQLIDIIPLLPAIFEYLKDNQKRAAVVRELYADFQLKYKYLLSIANAIDVVGETLREIRDVDDNAKQMVLTVRIVEDFFNFESNYTHHKSLETWNRIKGAVAECCDTDHFLWISHFYMNFSVLTSIVDRISARAKELLKEWRELLEKRPDRWLHRLVEIVFAVVGCVEEVSQAMGRFVDTLG